MRTIVAVVAIAAALAIPAHGQSLTGRWLGKTPDGGAVGLELTAAGSALTGTFMTMRGGYSLPLPIVDGARTGSTFTFRVVAGSQSTTFSGELSGDQISLQGTAPGASGLPPVVMTRVEAFPRNDGLASRHDHTGLGAGRMAGGQSSRRSRR